MARRTFGRGVIGVLGAAATAMLSGCGFLGGNGYRFKMTVEVDTPQGVKTGSSVYKVIAYTSPTLTSEEKPGGGGMFGQATIVELAGGPLFILLKMPRAGDSLDVAATYALRPQTPDRGQVEDYVAAVGALGGWSGGAKAELPRKDWPMMVRFRDLNDPKSVEEVRPEAIGVKRILVETTGDDVTTGIEGRLGWLKELEASQANSVVETSSSELAGQLRSF